MSIDIILMGTKFGEKPQSRILAEPSREQLRRFWWINDLNMFPSLLIQGGP